MRGLLCLSENVHPGRFSSLQPELKRRGCRLCALAGGGVSPPPWRYCAAASLHAHDYTRGKAAGLPTDAERQQGDGRRHQHVFDKRHGTRGAAEALIPLSPHEQLSASESMKRVVLYIQYARRFALRNVKIEDTTIGAVQFRRWKSTRKNGRGCATPRPLWTRKNAGSYGGVTRA